MNYFPSLLLSSKVEILMSHKENQLHNNKLYTQKSKVYCSEEMPAPLLPPAAGPSDVKHVHNICFIFCRQRNRRSSLCKQGGGVRSQHTQQLAGDSLKSSKRSTCIYYRAVLIAHISLQTRLIAVWSIRLQRSKGYRQRWCDPTCSSIIWGIKLQSLFPWQRPINAVPCSMSLTNIDLIGFEQMTRGLPIQYKLP